MYHLKKWSHQLPVALITTAFGLLLLAVPLGAQAQTRTDSVRVFFRTGQSSFDPTFQNNGEAIDAFIRELRASQADTSVPLEVDHVIVESSSSPEGSLELNQRLAKSRQQSVLDYVGSQIRIRRGETDRSSETFDWDMLRCLVQEDRAMPLAHKENVLDKLDSADPLSVNALKGTETWTYLMDNIFPKMRTTLLVFVQESEAPGLDLPEIVCEEGNLVEPFLIPDYPILDTQYKVAPASYRAQTRAVVLKLNLLTLPALIVNGGVEIQPLAHFSLNVPVYFSGINWFTSTIKFRTLAFQPEVRYWLREDLHGLFFGAHATFGWYNVALGGDYRYQDHAARTPSFGGGIGLGYKLPLGRNNDARWGLEFGIGGGVLPLRYDVFYNVENGRLAAEDQKKTYWGVDQAFISVTYRIGQFKLKQK